MARSGSKKASPKCSRADTLSAPIVTSACCKRRTVSAKHFSTLMQADSQATDEDFVHSQLEDKTLAPIAKAGAYMRPLSRVGLATKFDVCVEIHFHRRHGLTVAFSSLSAPTIAIYHIPSASILSSRLKPAELRSDTIDASIAAWLEGKRSPTALKSTIPNLGEVAYRMRWSLALAAIALLYQLLLVWGGDTFR